MLIVDINIKTEHPFNREGEPKRFNDKIYIWQSGETIFENLKKRRCRPYTTYKKELFPKLMETLQEKHPEIYEQVKDVKWGWNQYCGCSMCPCSPGFVGDKKRENKVINIHVTIK